jgi:hypothetical protein
VVRVEAGAGNFSLHYRVQTGSGAHPAYQMGTRGSFSGVRRSGREADHSAPSSADVKNACSYPPLPNTPSWHGTQLKNTGTILFFTILHHAMGKSSKIVPVLN